MFTLLRRLARRLRALVSGQQLDRELDDEVRFHLEMEAADIKQYHGVATGEAMRQARVAFGGVSRFQEEQREARGVRWLEDVTGDVKYATRALIRSPAFSISAVLVLALGIGASTAVFSAIDAVLLTRLPYPADDRLVRIVERNTPTNQFGASVVDYRGMETQARSLSAIGAADSRTVAVSFGGDPERAQTSSVTASFFRALGVRAARGRLILASDEPVGAPPVAVISHAVATRAFGSDAGALGRTVTVDGTPHTVVGVLAPGVNDLAGMHAQIWPVLQLRPPTRRGPFGLRVVGRMADGMTLDATRRDLAAVSLRLLDEWRPSFQDSTARLTPLPLRQAILGNAGDTLLVFAAAVGLVLLIAVANVASLTLVRTAGRWREVTLRTTLGATRARLVRLLVTESIVLALAGAALGVALGAVGLRILALVASGMPRLDAAHLDLRAVLFAVGVALVSGLIVGAYPVALLLRGDGASALRDGSRTSSAGRGTQALRGAFVIAEFALALPLLAGAGLLLNSFMRLQRVRPGFEAEHLLTIRVALPGARYANDTTVRQFWERALPRVREVPGVREAAVNTAMPPNDQNVCCDNFDLLDHPVAPGGAQPVSPWMMATPEYFTALGLPVLEGRQFTPADTGAAPVIIVSRSWARHYFPEGNVIGRQLIQGGCVTCPHTTVIGVTSDVKYTGLGDAADAVYSPLSEGWGFARSLVLFVRTASPPRDALAGVQAALRSVDPGVPLDDAAPMLERMSTSVAQPRQLTSLIGGFAAAALGLAAIGIFGMLSYSVSARRREIGVRMALGARHREVVAMVVRRGMGHALAGAALGLVVTVVAARGLASALFQVTPTDPPTLVVVTLLLLAVALVASWLPARRAATIDPIEAIRAE